MDPMETLKAFVATIGAATVVSVFGAFTTLYFVRRRVRQIRHLRTHHEG